jgi:AraC family transcriptional regulator
MHQNFDHAGQDGRIARLVDYIFKHYDQDVSLETLAGVGHYSKDHLPRLFKDVVGETPKKYSLALRLEAAFHYLIIHPEKPVQDIALEGGFSALSVFSRAIKNRWGYSPEEIRRLPHGQQMRLLHGGGSDQPMAAGPTAGVGDPDIRVVRRELVKGIYVATPFNDTGKIGAAFRALFALSRAGDEHSADPDFYGILTPHLRNSYRAFLPLACAGVHARSHDTDDLSPIDPASGLPAVCSVGEIKKGMFAQFTVMGDLRITNKAAHYFYRRWLPASGFRIAGIAGFERFEGNPAEIPYESLKRMIHIPIEPTTQP